MSDTLLAPTSHDDGREVRSLKRGLTALALVNEWHSMSIAQLAAALRLPRTTTERLLHTLVGAGYLERTPDDKQYRPTAKVLRLSSGYTPQPSAPDPGDARPPSEPTAPRPP